MKLVSAVLLSGLIGASSALAAAPSIVVDQPAPALGDTVTVTVEIPKLKGWEYPMVAISCYQDVNGDSVIDTDLLGPDVVYTELNVPDAVFTLGGYSSIWTLRGGGFAKCRADLNAYGWKAGVQSIRLLATEPFVAES